MSCSTYDVFDREPLSSFFYATKEDLLRSSHFLSETLQRYIIYSLNLFNHVVIVALTVAMAYKCWLLDFKKTALHAHLCTMGFVFIMAEGMMVRYIGNVFLKNNMHSYTKNVIHGLLQFVGGSLGIGGSLQKYWGKEIHFKSLHAKLGLAACILSVINCLTGLGSLLFPSALSLFRLFHGILGIATFTIGMLAQFYSYDTGFFIRNFTYEQKKVFNYFTLLVLALSILGPLKLMALKLETLLYKI